jgi:hypothetical protein
MGRVDVERDFARSVREKVVGTCGRVCIQNNGGMLDCRRKGSMTETTKASTVVLGCSKRK